MGRLTTLYTAVSSTIMNIGLRQAVTLAGDGHFLHEESYLDFREYLEMIDLNTMERFIDEALSDNKLDKFQERGYALQDIVNEIGRRLGYKVTNGLYKGTKGEENGLDGLWESTDGTFIVMESKTTDSYSLDIKTVQSYRDKLIKQGITTREKSSVLIVLGRDDRNTIPSLVRGSRYREEIRVISTRALFELLCIYEKNQSATVKQQIMQLLKPYDYTKLDNLISLVFPPQSSEKQTIHTNIEPVFTQEIKEFTSNQERIIVPDLHDDKDMKIGEFVFVTMKNLSDSGYAFNEDQIRNLCSTEWGHSVLKLGNKYPFAKIFDENEDKPHYIGKYVRFRSSPLKFGDVRLLITKELYERSREAFKDWYRTL